MIDLVLGLSCCFSALISTLIRRPMVQVFFFWLSIIFLWAILMKLGSPIVGMVLLALGLFIFIIQFLSIWYFWGQKKEVKNPTRKSTISMFGLLFVCLLFGCLILLIDANLDLIQVQRQSEVVGYAAITELIHNRSLSMGLLIPFAFILMVVIVHLFQEAKSDS